jgi:hypothetical protein
VSLGIEEMASSPLDENPCKDLGNNPLKNKYSNDEVKSPKC